MKKRNFLFIGSLVVCILLVLAGIGIGNYFYELALNPSTDKSSVFEAEHNKPKDLEIFENETAWFESMKKENLSLDSEDNLKLQSYLINQEDFSNRYVIIAHGYMGNATRMAAYAKHFYDQGYNILIPDARGHGRSEGDYIGMGWHERKDMLRWIDEVVSSNSNAEIVLYGISMGAATVMSTSGENLPMQVKAIVEDCGYTSVKDIFAHQLKELYNLPSFPVLNFASFVTYMKAGYTHGEASSINQVAKATKPMLFIHGTEDSFVPYEMVYELYEKANVEKEIFIVDGASHGEAAAVAGDQYWDIIFNFLNNYMKS